MEESFAKKIEAKKALIEVNQHELAQMRLTFTNGLKPFARTWIESLARQYIERNPAKSLALGKDRLTLLKTGVSRLCEDIDRICEEVFSDDAFWPDSRDLISQNQLGVRIILGKLGVLLEEFGFVKTKAQTEEDRESWSQYDTSGDRREFDGTPIYPHSIEIPEALSILLEEYRILLRKKDILVDEIKNLEHDALKIQATALWDSI